MYGFGKKDKYSHFVRNSHVTLEARQRYKKLLDFDTLDKKYYDQDYKRPDPPAGDDGVWNAIKELVLDPYFAPGMAENLSSIPETYIMTAGRDPLRDEGVIFAQRLVDSGVAGVGHEHHQDMVHGQAFQHTDAIKSMATLIQYVFHINHFMTYIYIAKIHKNVITVRISKLYVICMLHRRPNHPASYFPFY